jgi:hypothetical protein
MGFVKAFLVVSLTEESFLKGHETLYPKISSINGESVRHFGALKMRFFNGHENLDPQVSCNYKASDQPFGGLTMRFFKDHETLG